MEIKKNMNNSYKLILIIAVIIMGFGFLLWGTGAFQLLGFNSFVATPQVTTAVLPTKTQAFKKYENRNLGLTLLYPSNYSYADKTKTNANNLLALSFLAAPGSDTMLLRVLPKKTATTLQEWMTAYTTSFQKMDSRTAGKSYLLYGVTNIQYKTLAGRQAAVFSIGDQVEVAEATLFMSKSYVVFLTHPINKLGAAYQQIISSLAF